MIPAYSRVEVEGFIDSAVREALQDSPSQADQDNLVDALVQSLERDASWVQLYGVTGQLVVPPITLSSDHLTEALRRAKAVSRPVLWYLWNMSLTRHRSSNAAASLNTTRRSGGKLSSGTMSRG